MVHNFSHVGPHISPKIVKMVFSFWKRIKCFPSWHYARGIWNICFPSTRKRKAVFFKFLQSEDFAGKAPFLGLIGLDGWPNRRIEATFSHFQDAALVMHNINLTYQVFICCYILVGACLISCSHVSAFVRNFWGRFNHLGWYTWSRI